MAAEQLCFFKFTRPLLERFGKEFFRNIPEEPGVYTFLGETGRILYVGQSQNLRSRLAYYKNAQPEREPRRIIRLVHQTARIELERCTSAEMARLRELALIGQHRPKFNVANTSSPTFTFFGLRIGDSSFDLRICMKQVRRDGEILIGAFRNRSLCHLAFRAIARTIVAGGSKLDSVFDFPAWFHSKARLWSELPREWLGCTEGLLRGENLGLVQRSAELLEREQDKFLRQVYEADFLILSEFAALTQQMQQERALHDVEVLSQEALQVSSHQIKRRKVSENDSNQSTAVAT